MWTYSGWMNNRNFDYDMGVVVLSSSIGNATGWLGYGYNTNNSFFTTPTFYNYSYPAAYPYNGMWMYGRTGYFDTAGTLLVKFNRISYGGQSGSGFYKIVNGSRIVYAVLSSGNSSVTNCPRITSQRFYDIRDRFNRVVPRIAGPTGLRRHHGRRPVRARGSAPSLSYKINNASDDDWSGDVAAAVYLSADADISRDDLLLQVRHYVGRLVASEIVELVAQNDPPQLPSYLAPGKYYVGIILGHQDDNIFNNDTDGIAAAPIVVAAAVPSGDAGKSAASVLTARAYPNPFNPLTTISYLLPRDESVSVVIYDVQGRSLTSWSTSTR